MHIKTQLNLAFQTKISLCGFETYEEGYNYAVFREQMSEMEYLKWLAPRAFDTFI